MPDQRKNFQSSSQLNKLPGYQQQKKKPPRGMA